MFYSHDLKGLQTMKIPRNTRKDTPKTVPLRLALRLLISRCTGLRLFLKGVPNPDVKMR